ncbi:MAG: ABC transporter permease subunit, partial [Acidobacteriota bacterium]
MLARDKRTLFASVLLPTLLMPLFFVASSFVFGFGLVCFCLGWFSYAIEGSEAAGVRDLLALALGQADTNTGIRLEEIQSEADPGDLEALPPPSASTFETLGVHAIVRAISAAEAQAVDAAGGDEGPGTEEVPRPRVTLYFLADSDASSTAVGALEDLLERALLIRQDALLSDAGFPIERSQMGSIVERTDVATASERTGSSIGRWAPLFLMLFLVIGGSVVAADTLAGEKERGTLETLLGSAASRRDIIGAKLTAIFSLGLVITVIQLANLALYAGLRIIDVPADFSVKLGPGVAVALLVLFLPLALLSAAALLWASGRSSTYKAFQIALFPLMLALIAPATAALLPGLELRSAVAAAPIAGVAVAVREVLVGRIDLPFLALAWLSTALAAALLVRTALIDLSDERLLTGGRDRAAHLGGIDLLSRHVLRYYAVGWAVIFLVSAGLSFGLRGQVLFNIVGVFFVGSLLLLKAYRLPVRRTLALRPVCGSVWAGVLLGAPSMFFVAAAVSQLSARFFPLPQEALERLGQGLLPADMGLFELLFFVAVLPGLVAP